MRTVIRPPEPRIRAYASRRGCKVRNAEGKVRLVVVYDARFHFILNAKFGDRNPYQLLCEAITEAAGRYPINGIVVSYEIMSYRSSFRRHLVPRRHRRFMYEY